MKGVILAGGKATRLRPLTYVTNKHLLPIYNKPMIFYPLEAMRRAGISDLLLITGQEHAGSFVNLLKNGKEFGFDTISYEIQSEAGGLAQAVSLAQDFARNEKLLVILGDNIFTHDLSSSVARFEKQQEGAVIFAKCMKTDSKHYGVVEIDAAGKVMSIEEKPENPKSDLAQTGIYLYDKQVFSFINNLKPSKRGELEITDLNSEYVKKGILTCEIMEGWWIDAGTSHDELLRANNMVSELVKSGELE